MIQKYEEAYQYLLTHNISLVKLCEMFHRLNITCASIDFLNDLVDTMDWEHRAIHSKQDSKAVQMEWGSYKTFEMLKDMYEDATVYLDRKYQKYLELKEIMKLKNAVLNQTE